MRNKIYHGRLLSATNRLKNCRRRPAQQEEFKHFGMDLEFLLRKKEKWCTTVKEILFKEGDIISPGEKGEEKEE